jgi:phosphatidylserine/phosphatidylglycerophosphate/cardiolipin synthase-like enzyme
VAVVDDDWATVGSSNIDPFSLLLAREANIVVRDPGFAGELRASLAAVMAGAAREIRPEDQSAAVAQSRGDAVDGQVDAALHALVGLAGAVAAQQLDLDVVQRIEVGEAVADRALQQRIEVEQFLLAGDRQQRGDRGLPFGLDAREDGLAQASSFTSRE